MEPTWDLWWQFHREEFLDLKRFVQAGGVRSRDELADVTHATLMPRVRESLCAALDQREHPELALGAMFAAARLSDAGEFPELLHYGPRIRAQLTNPRKELADIAALSLGVLNSATEWPQLEAVLRDNEAGRKLVGAREVPRQQRCFAAYGLGLAAAQSADVRMRQVIARALTDILQREDGRSIELDVACIQALALVALPIERVESRTAPWISRQTQVRFLAELVRRPNLPQAVEVHALVALGTLCAGTPAEVIELGMDRALARLRDPATPAPIRAAAVRALGSSADADASELDGRIAAELVRSAREREISERSNALMALALVAARPGSSETPLYRQEALRKELLTALDNSRTRVAAWAALALGVLEHRTRLAGAAPHEETAQALRQRLEKAQSLEERGALAVAIGLARDEAGCRLLLAALEQETEDTLRGYLALGLGLGGYAPAVNSLRTLTLAARNKPFLLEQGAVALALLGERTISASLIEQLKETKSLAAQAWLSRTIGMISEESAVPALLELVRDEKLGQDPRAQAAMAIGRILDPDPLPWIQPYASTLEYRVPTAVMIAGDGSGLLEMQ